MLCDMLPRTLCYSRPWDLGFMNNLPLLILSGLDLFWDAFEVPTHWGLHADHYQTEETNNSNKRSWKEDEYEREYMKRIYYHQRADALFWDFYFNEYIFCHYFKSNIIPWGLNETSHSAAMFSPSNVFTPAFLAAGFRGLNELLNSTPPTLFWWLCSFLNLSYSFAQPTLLLGWRGEKDRIAG